MSTPMSSQPSAQRAGQQPPQSARMQRQVTNTSVSTPPASGTTGGIAATPMSMAGTPGRSPRNFHRSNVGGKSMAPSTLGMSSPMAAAAAQAMGNLTPSTPAGRVAFDTPLGLGIDLANHGSAPMTQSLSSMGLGGSGGLLGGVSMSAGLSMLGVEQTLSAIGKLDDAERTRRLEAAIKTIGRCKGRISRDGVERLGRRVGMDTLPEGRLLSLAGNTIVVDVEFAEGSMSAVDRVSLAYHGLSDAVSEHAVAAARIMHEDLKPPPGKTAINATLDKFAENLERLSRMDKLSVPSANCFEAVTGIHASLKRLYDHEKKIAEAIRPTSKDAVRPNSDAVVMHRQSGKPRMHSRRRVGLAVDYWSAHHLVRNSTANSKKRAAPGPTDDAMDTDDPSPGDDFAEHDREEEVCSLFVECEYSPPALYTPIRISHDWISEAIEKKADANEAGAVESAHDWLEPLAPHPGASEGDSAALGVGTTQTQSQARFVARLEPAVHLPALPAIQLFADVQVDVSHEAVPNVPFDQLIIPEASSSSQAQQHQTMGTTRHVQVDRQVARDLTTGDDSWTTLALFVPRPEAGRTISSIPFAHPKQLVAALPTLRQYAFTCQLLRRSFAGSSETTRKGENGATTVEAEDELSDLMNTDSDSIAKSDPLRARRKKVDVTLSTSPTAQGNGAKMQLSIRFGSTDESSEMRNVLVHILPNAEIIVESHNVPSAKAQSLAQALAVCEDIGIWAEWVRAKYLSSTI